MEITEDKPLFTDGLDNHARGAGKPSNASSWQAAAHTGAPIARPKGAGGNHRKRTVRLGEWPTQHPWG